MLTIEENELLTRVTGDAPMAQLMRQHWTPVCLMEEVAEPDGKPLRVEVLGESYVAFAIARAGWGCLTSFARTVKLRWSMAGTKIAVCAVSTMVGRWTLTATSWRCRLNLKVAH